MIVLNKYSAPHRVGKICKDKYVTVPNRSLSIQEVVARFASGQPLDIPPGQYGRQEVPIGDFDLADRVAMRQKLKAELEQVQKVKQEKAKAAAEKKRQAEIDDAVAQKLAEKEMQGNLPPKPSDA